MKHPYADCDNCPLQSTGQYVPPEVNGHSPENPAKYVFVGEAPGHKETRNGKPFVGISGKLLDALLEGNGISRKDALLTNTVLCRPKGNADPPKEAIAACDPALRHDIAQAKPEYVVALGKAAASAIMGHNVKITKERVGPPREIEGVPYKVLPTIHPAATLRNPNLFPLLDSDITKLVKSSAVTWHPPKWKDFNHPKQALIVLRQLEQRLDPEHEHYHDGIMVIDLEVGQDKDEDFGHPNTLLSASITYEPDRAVVLGHRALQDPAVRRMFAQLLSHSNVVCQNGKYDLQVLRDVGIGTFRLYADTMLMSYTQNELKGVHGLEYMGQEILGAPNWKHEFHDKCGTWPEIAEAIYNDSSEEVKYELHKYNAYDSANTWTLMDIFDEWMDEDDKRLHKFLCWASDNLMLVESDGVKLDRALLEQLDGDMQNEIDLLNKELNSIGMDLLDKGKVKDADAKRLIEKHGKFNPNSPVQVKGVLSALLNGATVLTTEADFLQSVLDRKGKESGAGYFCHLMLEQRSVGKMHGTYVKGWMRRMDDNDRIRTSYLIHGTETGRLSARNPNVQNPPRGEFRKCVIADEGNKLIYADFGNIEGRVVSVEVEKETGDDSMLMVLSDLDRDIHGEVAEMVYGSEFTKEQRVNAKTVVHGGNYARTAEGIAEGLSISPREASKVYNAYHTLFPGVREWHGLIKERVITNGETLITPWGRKRRFGLITRENAEDVYKEALAFKPQSIGSDICLTAACRLREMGYGVRIIIHDGIVVECKEEDAERTARAMDKVMQEAALEYTDKVPFPVDIAIGDNWGELE